MLESTETLLGPLDCWPLLIAEDKSEVSLGRGKNVGDPVMTDAGSPDPPVMAQVSMASIAVKEDSNSLFNSRNTRSRI